MLFTRISLLPARAVGEAGKGPGGHLSRIDRKLTAAGEAPLELGDLLAALDGQAETKVQDWRSAIACYLSASEGWRDASRLLGGTFAGDGTEPGGSGGKER